MRKAIERHAEMDDRDVDTGPAAGNGSDGRRDDGELVSGSEGEDQSGPNTEEAAIVARAVATEGAYVFVRTDREGRTWWDCLNTESGETYETTQWNCTCWDYAVRRKHNGQPCKHMIILELHLQAEKTYAGEIILGRRNR